MPKLHINIGAPDSNGKRIAQWDCEVCAKYSDTVIEADCQMIGERIAKIAADHKLKSPSCRFRPSLLTDVQMVVQAPPISAAKKA